MEPLTLSEIVLTRIFPLYKKMGWDWRGGPLTKERMLADIADAFTKAVNDDSYYFENEAVCIEHLPGGFSILLNFGEVIQVGDAIGGGRI